MPTTDTDERRVADRYVLKRQIGAGGMGVVWEALDELLARRVAIKAVELPSAVVGVERAKFAARVLREARAAARLTHHGAVTLYDVIREHGTTYIVMELVEAPSLATLVAEDGPLPPDRAARIGLQLLAALETAHGRGIVHRDVKPGNVLVLPDGRTKLTDFGIAALHGDPELTATGMVLGSPGYMAPEQASGESSGPAADIYGLGATLYYAVEGQPPFEKGGAIPTMTAVVMEEPRPMRNAGPLAPVIARLMAKDPARRPPSAEARRLLRDVAERAGQPAPGGRRGGGRAAAAAAAVEAAGAEAAGDTAIPEPPADQAETRREHEAEPGRDRRQGEAARRAPAGRHGAVPAPGATTVTATGTAGRTRALAVLAGLLAVVVAGALLASRAGGGRDDGSREPGGVAAPTTTVGGAPGGGGGAGTSDSSRPPPTLERAPSTAPGAGGEAGAIPEGWRRYRGPNGVYRLAYPGDWTVRRRGGRLVDFTQPGGGTYLRVDWTDKPQEPVENWIRYERQFAATHAGYRKLRLEPTTFNGMRGAYWEYRYRAGGRLVHAINITFVAPGGRFAYAFNFQTGERNWAATAGLREDLRRHFEVPGARGS